MPHTPEFAKRDKGLAWLTNILREREERGRQIEKIRGQGAISPDLDAALTALPLGFAAKGIRAGQRLLPAADAAAFLTQFDDSKMGRDVQDALAIFPVFGGASTKGLVRAQERLRRAQEKGRTAELPFFQTEGKMAPRRLKTLRNGMERWIEIQDPQKTAGLKSLLDEWYEHNQLGRFPVDKKDVIGSLPSKLTTAFHQTLKESGYRGIDFGEGVQKYSPKSSGYRRGVQEKDTAKHLGAKTWEELKPFEQSGGMPKGVSEFLEKRLQDVRRERAKSAMEGLAIGSAAGMGANASMDGEQNAGLVVNRRNLPQIQRLAAQRLAELEQMRPKLRNFNEIEALFSAKYPKLYKKTLQQSGQSALTPGYHGANTGWYDEVTGNVGIGMPFPDVDAFGPGIRGESSLYNMPGGQDIRRQMFGTMGHETLHSADFGRLGRVNDPANGKRITIGDFMYPDDPDLPWRKSVERKRDRIKTINRSADLQPDFWRDLSLRPDDWDEFVRPRYASDTGDYERYLNNPIELRARKASDTAEAAFTRIMDELSRARKEAEFFRSQP